MRSEVGDVHFRLQSVALMVAFLGGLSSVALTQVSDYTAEMDRRLRTIAGSSALNCGTVAIGGDRNPEPMLKCARRAIGKKRAFYARTDSWGIDSFLSEGFAGSGDGSVYYVEFDSLGWDPHRTEAGNKKPNLGEKCPNPVHVRRIPWIDNDYVGLTCRRKKKGSSDPHEW
ncbi:MAG: hypothetical protein WBF04_25225 [Candidatus Sulfotelmatobacter sp.]